MRDLDEQRRLIELDEPGDAAIQRAGSRASRAAPLPC
jgi:hypothetical protein